MAAKLHVSYLPTGKTGAFYSDDFWQNFFNQADKTQSEGEHESFSLESIFDCLLLGAAALCREVMRI